MRIAAVTIALTMFAITGANAQVTFSTNANPPSTFSDQIIRVTSSFRAPIATTESQTVPDAKSQDAARRELYRMAEGECAALSEIYKAECHLTSVTISSPLAIPPNSVPANALNATALYELRRNRAQ